MKILLLCEFFPVGEGLKFSGGVEARTYFLAKYLATKHEVTVLTSRVAGPRKEKINGFTVLRVGNKRRYLAAAGGLLERINFIRQAITVAKTIDADIVDGSNFLTHFIAKRISLHTKIPSVAWYPDVWLGQWTKNTGIIGILGEALERFNLANGFDAYIAISKSTAKKLSAKIKKNISIIPCGVDKNEFKDNPKKSDVPTIICVSRLAKYKNIKDLVMAFALVSQKIKKAKLIIVGSGPESKNLKDLVKNLKLQRKTQFLSSLPRRQLLNLYLSSSVFCLPSQVEGFGIVVVEAAAAKTPYVISDIDVFKEVTQNGKGGLLFKLGDAKDLADKLEMLLTDKNLYHAKQKEGGQLVKNYLWEDIAKKTQKVYQGLLKNT